MSEKWLFLTRNMAALIDCVSVEGRKQKGLFSRLPTVFATSGNSLGLFFYKHLTVTFPLCSSYLGLLHATIIITSMYQALTECITHKLLYNPGKGPTRLPYFTDEVTELRLLGMWKYKA